MGGSSEYSDIQRCNDCLKTIKADKAQTCGEVFCKVCHKHVPSPHIYFIPVDIGTPKDKNLLFVFYDLETRQEQVLDDGSPLHEPNLCIFKQACSGKSGSVISENN